MCQGESHILTGRYIAERAWEASGEGARRRKVPKGQNEPKKKKTSDGDVFSKKKCDVFFCRSQTRVAQASRGIGPEPESIAGEGLRAHQLWDRVG
jgi:hypothetical protein